MGGGRGMELTRNQMMQKLFGEQSEDEEEEGVVSGHQAAVNRSGDHSGKGEGEVEGQGAVAMEIEAELQDMDVDQGDNVGAGIRRSPEREISDQRMESEPKDAASEVESTTEKKKYSKIIREVFGDSDEEEPAEYGTPNEMEQDSHEEEGTYAIVPENKGKCKLEDEDLQSKRGKSRGPQLELEIPLRPPPGPADRMNIIKVSNIMGIDPKPFDPKTYVEEDAIVTDELGEKRRIRVGNNIVRWRAVQKPDGTTSYESNARFVRWEDGSTQLLIGNEVLNLSVNDSEHDERHLFLRHGKGVLQSQGKLLHKMRFTPSSLSSTSHRLLSALVDSQHKKVHKVKNCFTDVDPETEKEKKERVEEQMIRANVQIQKKREAVNRKYGETPIRGQQLSPGFLEALDEDDEPQENHSLLQSTSEHIPFEKDMEAEAQAERRIINAKTSNIQKNPPHKSSLPAARLVRHPERKGKGSEYQSKGKDIVKFPAKEPDHEDKYKEDEAYEKASGANPASEEDQHKEPREKKKETGGDSLKGKKIDGDSLPRKKTAHRRKAVILDSDEE